MDLLVAEIALDRIFLSVNIYLSVLFKYHFFFSGHTSWSLNLFWSRNCKNHRQSTNYHKFNKITPTHIFDSVTRRFDLPWPINTYLCLTQPPSYTCTNINSHLCLTQPLQSFHTHISNRPKFHTKPKITIKNLSHCRKPKP